MGMISALKGGGLPTDPRISALAEYLRTELAIENRAELMRIVDILTNKASLYKVTLPGPNPSRRGSSNQYVSSAVS